MHGEDKIFFNYPFNYPLNFTPKGKNIIKDLVNEEYNINYENCIFKSGDLKIKNFDMLKKFGTLYDSLINLLNEKMSSGRAKQEQKEMINQIAMSWDSFKPLEEKL